jgi:hypothetical protein
VDLLLGGSIFEIDAINKLHDATKDSKPTSLPYREVIGSIIYLMLATRPDIAFPISLLSRYQDKATDEHYKFAMQLLKYLRKSIGYNLVLGATDENFDIIAYCDSDWAGSLEDRKSTAGCIIKIGDSVITWTSKKQSTVATSTAEAEYYALYNAAQETQWTKSFLNEIGIVTLGATVHCDHQSCIAIAKNPQFHARTKHVDIKYHFVRELVENKEVNLNYCATADMQADGLTKLVSGQKLKSFVKALNLTCRVQTLKGSVNNVMS